MADLSVARSLAASQGVQGGGPPDAWSAELERWVGVARDFQSKSKAQRTRSVYEWGWRVYEGWSRFFGADPLSGNPRQLGVFLSFLASDREVDGVTREGMAVSSLRVIRAAIKAHYVEAGVAMDFDNRILKEVMEGIARDKSGRSKRQARAAVPGVLRAFVFGLAAPEKGIYPSPALLARNRALLMVGAGAALRRSELVALRVSDVDASDERGLMVYIWHSKTDQHGEGRYVAIPANPSEPGFCPRAVFLDWMEHRKTGEDWVQAQGSGVQSELPVFCWVSKIGRVARGGFAASSVAVVVKRAADACGIDPTDFSGHSLRRGMLTDAGNRQVSVIDLMRHSRHKSVDTALGYIEQGDLWRANIAEGFFKTRKA